MVYLLHYDRPVGHMQHYVGFVRLPANLEARLVRHRSGRGGRMPAVVARRGGSFSVVRVWPEGTLADERRIKRTGPKTYCPICARRDA